MKKQSFFAGTILLIVGGFISKVFGALYKIPLTNIIGSEGIGMYYLVFPLYNLLLVVCSSGVGIAVTKLIAREQCRKNQRLIFISSILISFILSMIASIIVIVFSKILSLYQGGILSSWGFIVIAPSIVIASLITVIKSYFQGLRNMVPSTLTMISEQVLKMVFGITFALVLIDKGVENAVLGSILGVTLSEAITLIWLLLYIVIVSKKKDVTFVKSEALIIKKIRKISINKEFFITMHSYQKLGIKHTIKRIISEMIPNTLIYLVSPMATFIDSFLIVGLLINVGFTSAVATSLYGINSGVVSTLIALPVIITSSLSTSLVPNLSESIQVCNSHKSSEKISFFIKLTWIIILPICVFFIIYSQDIISALYHFSSIGDINELSFAVKLLRISSISVIYSSLMSTLIAIIQSIEKPYKLFLVLCISITIRFLFIILSMPKLNIFGVVVGNNIYYILVTIWCITTITKKFQFNSNYYRFFIIPSISIITGSSVSIMIAMSIINVWVKIIFGGGVMVIIYLAILLWFRAFEWSELDYIPVLKKLYIKRQHGYNLKE